MGALLTLGLVLLHLEHHRYAGALWRDEVNSVNVVSLPSAADAFSSMHYDSFPAAWITLLYGWKAAGLGDGDQGYRRLGLAIGLAMIAATWWTGWRLGVGPPLVTLLLFGMSPSTIVYGDMVRGYGLAALAIVWSLGALWAFVQRPSWHSYLVAQTAFVVAAQTHFANAVVLLGIGLGAAAACWRLAKPRLALAALAIGGVAAVLLVAVNRPILTYMSTTAPQERGRWRSLDELFAVFAGAIAPEGGVFAVTWLIAAVLAGIGYVVAWQGRRRAGGTQVGAFAAVVFVLAFAGTFGAYELTRLPTQYWHYLSLIAVSAFACEVGIAALAARLRRGAWLRVAGVGIAALLAAPGVAGSVHVRMTSIDLAAAAIEREAGPADLVVVFPWYCGITFDRYYRGSAPWITLPDLPAHKFHLHLAIRERMALGEAGVETELARVEQTLRRGGRVWVVGSPLAPDAGSTPPPLPPPHALGSAGAHLDNWELQLGSLLEKHAAKGQKVPLPDAGTVNAWENLPLFVVEGWR